jgi:hypothetical protein
MSQTPAQVTLVGLLGQTEPLLDHAPGAVPR